MGREALGDGETNPWRELNLFEKLDVLESRVKQMENRYLQLAMTLGNHSHVGQGQQVHTPVLLWAPPGSHSTPEKGGEKDADNTGKA